MLFDLAELLGGELSHWKRRARPAQYASAHVYQDQDGILALHRFLYDSEVDLGGQFEALCHR